MNEKMIEINLKEKAMNNFESIKKGLKGLYEVLRILLESHEPLFGIGLDNILAIYQNFLELNANTEGMKYFQEKLKNNEIDLDIPLDFLNLDGELY